jgi:hypothetical protein
MEPSRGVTVVLVITLINLIAPVLGSGLTMILNLCHRPIRNPLIASLKRHGVSYC